MNLSKAFLLAIWHRPIVLHRRYKSSKASRLQCLLGFNQNLSGANESEENHRVLCKEQANLWAMKCTSELYFLLVRNGAAYMVLSAWCPVFDKCMACFLFYKSIHNVAVGSCLHFSVTVPVASKTVYMTAIENHKRYYPGSGSLYNTPDSGGKCGVPYRTYFRMPVQDIWYSMAISPMHFTVISTEHDWSLTREQYTWMKSDLESVDRFSTPWIVFTGCGSEICSSCGTIALEKQG
ncbi:hypothetical protein SELMODRAFT_410945 [Selaginella moellendorffii]|uniref:Uncharacterized protein n=1 Tax=Selaginella moellendorffii TaxID=88036 RepID=D8RGD4_SELML|nr:hypothetical protein SELMODRAFT_410945 [Selaginella moellendorffii]